MYMFMPGGRDYVDAANLPLRDQMLFATGYPGRPLLQSIEECAALPFSPEARAKFMSGNAARLLGLKQRSPNRAPSSRV
jgi:predicted TIM-barrel fold metal-dependent hydrolase